MTTEELDRHALGLVEERRRRKISDPPPFSAQNILRYEILSRMELQERSLTDGIDAVQANWARERPDIDVSSMGIVSRVWRIGRYLDKVRNDRLAEWDTDRATIDILGMLRRSGEPYRQSAGQLTKHSLITSGGVSQRLEKLERAGLVTRHVDTNDRRRVDVELTAAGVELVDKVLYDVVHAENELIAAIFSEDDQAHLRDLLRTFLLAFEAPSDVQ